MKMLINSVRVKVEGDEQLAGSLVKEFIAREKKPAALLLRQEGPELTISPHEPMSPKEFPEFFSNFLNKEYALGNTEN
jgi:hypothetical protein